PNVLQTDADMDRLSLFLERVEAVQAVLPARVVGDFRGKLGESATFWPPGVPQSPELACRRPTLFDGLPPLRKRTGCRDRLNAARHRHPGRLWPSSSPARSWSATTILRAAARAPRAGCRQSPLS